MPVSMRPIIRPMLEFGPCLKQILSHRKISASELARMMAYRSRNSIFRLLDGEGAHGTRQAFFDRLIAEDPLSLTEAERAELRQALEISRVGLLGFLSNRALCELLLDFSLEESAESIRMVSMDGSPDALDSLRKAYPDIEELSITITGCCSRQICRFLNKQLSAIHHAKLSITHYVYTGEEEIVRNISAIQPLLYRSDYTAYAVEPGMFSREKQRLYRNNMVFCHIRTCSADTFDQCFILVDKGLFIVLKQRGCGSFSQLDSLFAADAASMRPIKKEFDANINYAAYTQECLRLEQNRAIYMVKQDIPLSYVHTDILLDCLLESLSDNQTQDSDRMNAYIRQLKQIHQQRFNNIFEKRKPTHTIFSRRAMERFARTGIQSDHFFAFRPYTPEERVRILRHLRLHAQENPNFHIHFARDEYESTPMEVALYDGVGVLMAKPNTHYNLADDHAEALIPQEGFCRKYKEFFVNDLLERHVFSKEESLKILDDLITIAQNA